MISPEKRKEYYYAFKEANGDKLKEKITCPECNGKYDYFNKSKHIKTQKHILNAELNKLKNN
jgi:transcription initiation factor IIE alpha subunit